MVLTRTLVTQITYHYGKSIVSLVLKIKIARKFGLEMKIGLQDHDYSKTTDHGPGRLTFRYCDILQGVSI